MKNSYFLIGLFFLLVTSAWCIPVRAQHKVTGSVTDAGSKSPLAGVTVLVEGTAVGASTDAKGAYSITIPAGKQRSLVFSFIGYVTDTVAVSTRTQVNVALQESSVNIEEVVVGYGKMRKSDITGSVASVKISETEASQVMSMDNLLKGRAAGVQVTTANAAPGGGVSIKIRGNSSFNGGGEPLYIIDGIMLNPPSQDVRGVFQGGSEGQEEQNGLMGISPADIANIEILKDASATAIYGSMGANGVVLITTKSGSSEGIKVTWNSTIEIASPRKRIPLLNFEEYLDFRRAADLDGKVPDGIFQEDGTLRVTPMDWQDYCLRTSVSQIHRVSISGQSKSTNYYISGGFSGLDGIVKRTNVQNSDLRINLDRNLGKSARIGTRSAFSYLTNNMTQGTEPGAKESTSMIRSMLSYRPYYNFNNKGIDDDQEGTGDELLSGPPAWLSDYSDESKQYRFTPSVYLEVTLVKGLQYRGTVGGDYIYKSRTRWYGNQLYAGSNVNGKTGTSSLESLRYNIDNTLTYNRSFENHRINAMVGMTIGQTINKSSTLSASDIDEQQWQSGSINAAHKLDPYYYDESKFSSLSFMARMVYSFKDRYVVTATVRADGSSKFAKGNKFSYFPSFAFAWRVNQEKFFETAYWLTNLKLRLGWGMVGNQALSPYQTRVNYASNLYGNHYGDSNYEVGVSPNNLPNPDLRWETTQQYNAGIDLGLLNDRINLVVDLYDKRTKDLLQNISISPSSGYSKMWVNRGEIQNRGLEISADFVPVKTSKVTWNIGGNISFNQNKITDIGLDRQMGAEYVYFMGANIGTSNFFRQPANIFIQGRPMGLFWGYKTKGIVQEGEVAPTWNGSEQPAGSVKFVDMTGDNDITTEDMTIIGNPNPKFTYGFSTSVNFYRFTFDMVFNGVYGNQIANGNLMNETNVDKDNKNNIRRDAFYKAWTPENPNTNYPALRQYSQYNTFTDRIVEDGSFLRLANVSLSYSVPVNKSKKSWCKALNVSFSAKNILTVTNYSGWDPEVSSYGNNIMKMGVDMNSYPNFKSYVIGINVTF